MICRLCLIELCAFVNIFNEDSKATDTEVFKLIQKYFHLEVLRLTDSVSTKICQKCWQTLYDFNQFQLLISHKQAELQLKTEHCAAWPEIWQPTESQQLYNLSNIPALETTEQLYLKDTLLTEPEIIALQHDVSEHSFSSEYVYDDDDRAIQTHDEKDTLEIIKTVSTFDLKAELLQENIEPTKKLESDTHTIDVNTRRCSSRHKKTSSTNNLGGETQTTKSLAKVRAGRPRLKPIKTPPSAETIAQVAERKAISRELDEYIAANAGKLECAICGLPMCDFDMVKRHFRNEHKCSGYVMCCNNRYRKRSLYVDHLRVHKDPTFFNCKLCNKNFINRNCHSLHMLRAHSDGSNLEFQCEYCPRRFPKSYLRTQHMRTHTKNMHERAERCKECDKSFRTVHALNAHAKRMHFLAPIVCDICGATFRTKQNFEVHKRAVHHIGPQLPEAQCKVCERWLRDENSLRKHMYQHRDNEKNLVFSCTECKAVKSSARKLASHMRYHHSGKRYKCTVCDKDFKQPILLDEHMATHTGVDLYTCTFCPRTFKSHANMHKHKKRMHPEHWVRKYTQPIRVLEQQKNLSHVENTLTMAKE